MELGHRLRTRRQELGLSLRELAERVGLTASFLSQIERDLASPSIESLRKISDALEVPIFHFLIEPEVRSPVVRRGRAGKAQTAGLQSDLPAHDPRSEPPDGGLFGRKGAG